MNAKYTPGDCPTESRTTELFGVSFEAAVWTDVDHLSDEQKLILMDHPRFVVSVDAVKAAATPEAVEVDG